MIFMFQMATSKLAMWYLRNERNGLPKRPYIETNFDWCSKILKVY